MVHDHQQAVLVSPIHTVTHVCVDKFGLSFPIKGFADTVKHPRGILGYGFEGLESIEGSLGEITWKVQGHLGGFYS